MTDKRPILMTLGLALAVAVVFLVPHALGPDGGAAPAVAPPHRESPVDAGEPRSADAVVSEPGLLEVDRRSASEGEPAADAEASNVVDEPSPAGIVVAGTVRYSGDAAPAPGVSFALSHGDGVVRVTTDGEGRFRTAPVVRPGAVRVLHRVSGAGGPSPRRLRMEPETLSIQAEPDGAEAEIELILLRPETTLEIRVTHLDGSPAPGATVELEVQHEPRPEEFENHAEEATTGPDGAASFALYDLEHLRAAGLLARLTRPLADGRTAELVSDDRELAMPLRPDELANPIRLVLDTGGSIRVRVIDASGEPVPGRRVWLSSAGPFLTAWAAGDPVSDEHGEVLFSGLPPREVRLGLVGGPGADRRVVTVRRAQIIEVEFVVSTPGVRTAVSGRVIDEEGAPVAGARLHVTYGPRVGPGDATASATTDEAGRFEFRAAPCDGLTIASDRDLFGDEYDPVSLELPFGSTDIVFRRTRTVPRDEVLFEVVDAASGERLTGALVMTYRAPRTGDYAFHRPENGLASPLCSLVPETTFAVARVGYRRATVALTDLMLQEPRDGLRRVRLEPGLLRTIHVQGEDENGERVPIEGARVLSGNELVGRTDSAGELNVDLHVAPGHGLTIEAPGYGPATWVQADGLADLEAAWIWLVRGS